MSLFAHDPFYTKIMTAELEHALMVNKTQYVFTDIVQKPLVCSDLSSFSNCKKVTLVRIVRMRQIYVHCNASYCVLSLRC